ncbi:N-acetylglucosamine-6-phosphate deacetylase [Kineosphaera limosa]|uniref:N-acetylglucosamine-6-phosphate deacetylase n=1 Tax=Kineosphaera limosa NBRC 100340 TaxID=1184609 RepID=K6W8K9_9MICO|nr:N-acetylglucosamine-6-phosphate deacetylase [Kineosphaera limosa]NYD99928.1 N-acetylglucosamine-6-phosphate deacetylase [Kineosphaera limosa]GAB95535.1 N-acetylglucosamine-6-phosphate deacetylase [Kineosphaera limosa NBRC 100340]
MSLLTADRVVTGEQILAPGWLEVRDGRVVAVGAGDPPRPADRALGAVTVVPGFVDMHVHGGGGGAFPAADAAATAAAVDFHRRHGTTAMLASLVSASPPDLLAQVEAVAEQVRAGLVAGIHLEGPWISAHRCGAHEPTALRAPDPAELDRVLAAGGGTIAMVTLAPELPGGLEAVRRVVDAGAIAAVGHTDATYEQTREAIGAGARVATHLFNAMRPVHHRDPGPVVALMEDPRVTLELITDGQHLHPALYRDVCGRAGSDRVVLVTDAMEAAGMADGAYSLGGLDVTVADGVARLTGTTTIAGSTATMDHQFRQALAASELPPDEALLAVTRQTSVLPAAAIGLPPVALAAGGPADLVVLDEQWGVTDVMKAGSWVALA